MRLNRIEGACYRLGAGSQWPRGGLKHRMARKARRDFARPGRTGGRNASNDAGRGHMMRGHPAAREPIVCLTTRKLLLRLFLKGRYVPDAPVRGRRSASSSRWCAWRLSRCAASRRPFAIVIRLRVRLLIAFSATDKSRIGLASFPRCGAGGRRPAIQPPTQSVAREIKCRYACPCR